MFIKEKVVKVIENAHNYLNLCIEEIDKIEEMFGGASDNVKLAKMKDEALSKKKDQIVMILGIIAPLADDIIKFPEFVEPFRYAEKLLLGKNFKFSARANN